MTELRAAVPKALRAERIELVDAEGNLRCRIGPRVWPTGEATPRRFFALEMFDSNGKCLVRLAMDDDGAYKGIEFGDYRDADGNIAIESRRLPSEEGTHSAAVGLTLGVPGSRRDISVLTGAFPSQSDVEPCIDHHGGYFRTQGDLDRAARTAQRTIDWYLASAEQAAAEGDRSGARSSRRQARLLQEGIVKAQAGVANRTVAWLRQWGIKREKATA